MIKFFNNKSKISGQMMLLSIVIIGTSIMVVTMIAGYLMVKRLRFSSNMVDSTKAVFAADAGTECELYNIFVAEPDIECNSSASGKLEFTDNLTSATTTIGNFVDHFTGETMYYIKSIGTSNKSKRAFYLSY